MDDLSVRVLCSSLVLISEADAALGSEGFPPRCHVESATLDGGTYKVRDECRIGHGSYRVLGDGVEMGRLENECVQEHPLCLVGT